MFREVRGSCQLLKDARSLQKSKRRRGVWGCLLPEKTRGGPYTKKGGSAWVRGVPTPTVQCVEKREECYTSKKGLCGGSPECMGTGIPALGEEGFPLRGEEGQAPRGAGRKAGSHRGEPGRGEGFRGHRSQRRGGSLEGNMCSGTTAIPRGRVESRAWAVWRGNQVSSLGSPGRISQPYSPRLPAKPSILRGKAPGSGLSGAGTSFSGRREWPTRSLTRSLFQSPGSAPGPRPRRPPVCPSVGPPRESQSRPPGPLPRQVESRAAPPPAQPPSQAAAASAAPRPAPAPARSKSPAPAHAVTFPTPPPT